MNSQPFGVSLARQPKRDPWSKEKLLSERAAVLDQVLEPGTKEAYLSGFRSYLAFCINHGFSFEPTPDTFSFYIVYMCAFVSPSSVTSYLSGISSHLSSYYADVHDVRRSPLVRNTLAGCVKRYGDSPSRKRALTDADLLHLHSHLGNLFAFDDLLFWVILLVGYGNC